MIDLKLSLSGSFMEDLDKLDANVLEATKEALSEFVITVYGKVINNIDSWGWNYPKTTGNLKRTTGYFLPDTTTNAWRNSLFTSKLNRKSSAGRRDAFDYHAPPPKPNPDAFVGNVFSLARYAPYLEFGTARMSARPYFFRALTEAEPQILSVFTKHFANIGSGPNIGFGYNMKLGNDYISR